MAELIAEGTSAQDIGDRLRQEDAVIAQFPQGGPGLAVLSDGMGGHDDGDLASRILVSEMFGEVFLAAARPEGDPSAAQKTFLGALDSANRRLQQHIGAGWISDDTGGTLLTVTVTDGQLRWISVGDSPLYLCRGDELHRLNEIHSMAMQLDLMVRNGAMDPAAARAHPHRHCLTSAVTGQKIGRIDCPEEAVPLLPGDVILLASDGLNVLDDGRIGALTRKARDKGCDAVARALLAEVRRENLPDQDNVSIVVIRMAEARPAPGRVPPVPQTIGPGIAALLRRLWPLGMSPAGKARL